MVENKQERKAQLSRWLSVAFGLPWFEITGELWKIGKKVARGFANEGMYEVLDYESTLELQDKEGRKASFSKQMKVRYLQDDNIAFQDYAWGDGAFLLDYQTSHGEPGDRYKSGYKT